MNQGTTSSVAAPLLRDNPVAASYPLSPMQQGMLFNSLYAPHGGVDIEQMLIDLCEEIDPDALKRAWDIVAARHDVLRTSFSLENPEQPLQKVHSVVETPFLFEDWSGRSGQDQAKQLQSLLEEDRKLGFDMSRPPLIRVKLLKIAESHFKLLWMFHHILLDRLSLPIVLHEWFATYEMFRKRLPLDCPDPVPYLEYISWVDQRDATGDQQFWKSELEGFATPTPIPEMKPAEKENQLAFDSADQTVLVSEATTSRLEELARKSGLSMNLLVQGAWAILLSRSSGECDVAFGTTSACRNFHESANSMVGIFINTLVTRVHVDENEPLLRWLDRLRVRDIAVRPHEHAPLSEIQAQSALQRTTPLFQSLLVFEQESLSATMNALDPAWKSRGIELFEKTNFPLTLTALGGSSLSLNLTYDPNRFEEGAIERILAHLQTLLESMAAIPDSLLRDIPWLAPAELSQLDDWNLGETIHLETRCVHELFDEQADRNPNATAAIYPSHASPGATPEPDQVLTYGELRDKSNQLARYLQRLGAAPDMRVGICIDRSVDVFVAIFGVLKSGATFVPLDPTYPVERLEFMMSNSDVSFLIVGNQAPLSAPATTRTIRLTQDWPRIAQESTEPTGLNITSDHLAYLMYTSGSTGRPKGVMVTHFNLANMFRAWELAYNLKSIRTHLQMARFSADVFAGDMVRALCSGGKLVLCPMGIEMMPEKLYKVMREHQTEIAEFVPVTLRSIIQYVEENNQPLDFMRLVAAGSDAWYSGEYQNIKRLLGKQTRLINSYGITETTVDSTYFETEHGRVAGEGQVPIGRPFANCQVYLLDGLGRRVPIGVPGEIYIGGPGVSKGYYKRPDLTEERFVPDPFSSKPDSRLYRSGDLGRYLPDGNIELIGRIDDQVKVRGHRVELGEIEGWMKKCPGVRDAVTTVINEKEADRELIGYVVGESEGPVNFNELRAFLRKNLPDYMVPLAFISMDKFPLTPNGKINRRALPAPHAEDFEQVEAYQSPANPVEARLVEIWKRVLNLKRIGVKDNFFDLGGHSLRAVHLFVEIKKEFQKELPLTALFQAITIEQLAKLLQEGETDWSSLVPLSSGGSKPPVFWLHTQGGGGGGGLFRYQKAAQFLPKDQPSFGIRAPQEPFDRMEAMAEFYLSEIRKVQASGPYHLAGYCFGGNVAFEMAQQLRAQGEEVAFLGMIESSPYYEVPEGYRWTPAAVLHFLINFGYWTREFLRQPPTQQWHRIKRKVAKLFTTLRKPEVSMGELDLGDFLDAFDRPPEYRKFVVAHWEALVNYVPRRYPGKITLFRVRVQHPFNFDPALWWGELTDVDVEIHMIPGNHNDLFDEPHVQVLASAVQSCLDRPRSSR